MNFSNIYHISQALERMNGAEEKQKCISTGNEQMDELLGGGLYPGELVTFVGHYLTLGDWLLVQIAKTVSKEQGIPTAIVSLDVSEDRIVRAILRMIKFGDEMSTKDVSEADLQTMPLYINDHHNMMLDELLSFIRMMAEEKGVKVFVITSIHRIPEYSPDNTIIGCALKTFCEELNITILVRTLPNHLFWEREGCIIDIPVPLKYMAMTCGLDEYSDCLIGMERPEVYHIMVDEKGNDLRGIVLLEVIKNSQIVGTPLCKRFSVNLFMPYLEKKREERPTTDEFYDEENPF